MYKKHLTLARIHLQSCTWWRQHTSLWYKENINNNISFEQSYLSDGKAVSFAHTRAVTQVEEEKPLITNTTWSLASEHFCWMSALTWKTMAVVQLLRSRKLSCVPLKQMQKRCGVIVAPKHILGWRFGCVFWLTKFVIDSKYYCLLPVSSEHW